jgi:hypothetical protein
VLRVYQLKSNLELRLLHSVQGHKNKNWPIKSAFFAGEGMFPPTGWWFTVTLCNGSTAYRVPLPLQQPTCITQRRDAAAHESTAR